MISRTAAAVAVLGALLALHVGVPLCAGAASHDMPCCKTSAPCATAGVTKPGCCGIEPVPDRPGAPSSLKAEGAGAGRVLAASGAAVVDDGLLDAESARSVAFDRSAAARSAPLPLFLLNGSFLC